MNINHWNKVGLSSKYSIWLRKVPSPFLGTGVKHFTPWPGPWRWCETQGGEGTSHTMTFVHRALCAVFLANLSLGNEQKDIFRFMGHGGSILFILRSRLAPIPCNMKGLRLSPNRSRKGAAEKVLPAYAIDSTSEKRLPTPSIHLTKSCPKQ